jgi:hypothetical protein
MASKKNELDDIHTRMMRCLLLLGLLFVGVAIGFIFCAMVYRF